MVSLVETQLKSEGQQPHKSDPKNQKKKTKSKTKQPINTNKFYNTHTHLTEKD